MNGPLEEYTCRELKTDPRGKNWLNLGCGQRTYPGFWNVDMIDGDGVDEIHDLLELPWPWDNNTWDYILISHWLEHIPHPRFFDIIDELLRVSDDMAIIEIKVPHYLDPKALLSPGHCRHVHSYTLRSWTNKGGYSNEHLAQKSNDIDLVLIDEGHIGHFRLGPITDYHWRKYLQIEPPKILCHSLDYYMVLEVWK